MPRFAIPGLDEALEQERHERDRVYISDLYEKKIGDFEIPNLTPISFAKLVEAKNCYVSGGIPTKAHVSQFIYIVRNRVVKDPAELETIAKQYGERLGRFDIEELSDQIDEFFDISFRDAPTGKSGSHPIASTCAWMEYRFSGDPWRWSRERTLNTPLRILYQQLRCHDKYNGEIVTNPISHKVQGDWLKAINEALQNGEITQEDLNKINEGNRKNG